MLAACDAAGVALVPLVAPTTPDERLAAIGARARGFLYTVSVIGTTGERAALDRRASPTSWRARRRATDVPVALGFGISTPEQAAQAAAAGADGVIVGQPPRARRGRRRGRPRAVRPDGRARERRPPRSSAAGATPPAGAPVDCPAAWDSCLATTAGLVVWIVLWALGARGVRRVPDHGRHRADRRDGADARPVPARQPLRLTRPAPPGPSMRRAPTSALAALLAAFGLLLAGCGDERRLDHRPGRRR